MLEEAWRCAKRIDWGISMEAQDGGQSRERRLFGGEEASRLGFLDITREIGLGAKELQ